MTTVDALVEGHLDAAVAARVLERAGCVLGTVYGIKGIGYIRNKVQQFNEGLDETPLLTMVDFRDIKPVPKCPGQVVQIWVSGRKPNHLFRCVVREMEAWLIGDGEGLAKFLGVAQARFDLAPEKIRSPKTFLLDIISHSRRKSLAREMVRTSGNTLVEGPMYTAELTRFVHTEWNLVRAEANCPSLQSCVRRISEID